jgi:prepilin-type N-terminal cleavage/methylation domain-containing protein
MNKMQKSAFTLIEMIIAITVFTIFIGFAISAYLTFHRADQDALTKRSLLMEAEAILNELSDATRQNKIDYDSYTGGSSGGVFPKSTLKISLGDARNEQTLYLISPDGSEQIEYTWDADEETLSVERFVEGVSSGEYVLNSENLAITYVNFKIFPQEDPYADTSYEFQYQPMVRFDLNFSMPGRMDPELTLELSTTVTSRYYQ